VAATALTATNGIYVVSGVSGRFSATTGASHPLGSALRLTYPNGGHALIHSYTSGTSYGLAGLSPTVSAIPGGVRQEATPAGADSLVVRQDSTITGTTAADSVVRFSVRIENTGATPVDVGARLAIDFMIAGDDGPTFTPEAGRPSPPPSATWHRRSGRSRWRTTTSPNRRSAVSGALPPRTSGPRRRTCSTWSAAAGPGAPRSCRCR
jgi:hypothetical protein